MPKPDGSFPDPGDPTLRDRRPPYVATGILQEMPLPDSTYATKGGTPARLGYYDNYLVDNDSCVIVGVQATAARMSQETVAAQDMLTRFAEWQGQAPDSVETGGISNSRQTSGDTVHSPQSVLRLKWRELFFEAAGRIMPQDAGAHERSRMA